MYGDILILVSYNCNFFLLLNLFLFSIQKWWWYVHMKYSIVVIISIFIALGAFLIPYFCVYFLIGTPLYFLELSLGQFGSRGASVAFKMSRMFKGNEHVY